METSATKVVLCVEDNPVNIFLVQAIFESRPQVQLLTATQGRSGLEIAQERRPDLILLDLNLPDMDGEEFLQQLRSNETIAATPVVIVSADALSEQRTHFLKLGVADYITKPFDLHQFEQVMDRYLGTAKNS